MVITSTPFRISFFGGGTDYPSWYRKHGGSVLSTTIDKYCYITCRPLPPFFEHRIRVAYSQIELCRDYTEIQHASVREALRFLNITDGLEIHHDGDLPARSGIGSSSSFTVGLLHALYACQGKMVSKRRLASESVHVEQNMIKEVVGSQDQVAAAFGGLNRIDFHRNGEFDVQPLILSQSRIDELQSSMMLFFTGINRTASEVAQSYSDEAGIQARESTLKKMHAMVDSAVDLLTGNDSINAFGELLHEGWLLKRQLSREVSNRELDEMYEEAQNAGAIGGKLIGAGGGGFLLLFVPPSRQQEVRKRLCKKICVPIKFDTRGSQVIFYRANSPEYREAIAHRAKHNIMPFKERKTSAASELSSIR